MNLSLCLFGILAVFYHVTFNNNTQNRSLTGIAITIGNQPSTIDAPKLKDANCFLTLLSYISDVE